MADPKTLQLNLHRRFFDEIAAGEKTTEWRDRTDYWARRLEGRDYDQINFRNGYAADAPEMVVEYRGVRKVTRGGEPQYAISLGRILKIKK